MSSDRNIEPRYKAYWSMIPNWKKPMRHSPSSSPMISSMPLHMENIKKESDWNDNCADICSTYPRESKRTSPIPWKRIDAMKSSSYVHAVVNWLVVVPCEKRLQPCCNTNHGWCPWLEQPELERVV